jgi:hypothetical protein
MPQPSSTFVDVTVRPIFLPIVPDRNRRTESGCQLRPHTNRQAMCFTFNALPKSDESSDYPVSGFVKSTVKRSASDSKLLI